RRFDRMRPCRDIGLLCSSERRTVFEVEIDPRTLWKAGHVQQRNGLGTVLRAVFASEGGLVRQARARAYDLPAYVDRHEAPALSRELGTVRHPARILVAWRGPQIETAKFEVRLGLEDGHDRHAGKSGRVKACISHAHLQWDRIPGRSRFRARQCSIE